MSPSLPPAAQGRDDLGRLITLDADELEAMPWQPLRGLDGVSHKVVWQSGDTVLGFIRVEPGAVKPEHTHHGAHHHILITHGSATMLGRPFSAGAYLYIPPDVAHEVADVGPDGCTFFYTYRPVEIPTRPPA